MDRRADIKSAHQATVVIACKSFNAAPWQGAKVRPSLALLLSGYPRRTTIKQQRYWKTYFAYQHERVHHQRASVANQWRTRRRRMHRLASHERPAWQVQAPPATPTQHRGTVIRAAFPIWRDAPSGRII
jgi:hypothetical protein